MWFLFQPKNCLPDCCGYLSPRGPASPWRPSSKPSKRYRSWSRCSENHRERLHQRWHQREPFQGRCQREGGDRNGDVWPLEFQPWKNDPIWLAHIICFEMTCLLGQWVNFNLFGITYLVVKNKPFKLLSQRVQDGWVSICFEMACFNHRVLQGIESPVHESNHRGILGCPVKEVRTDQWWGRINGLFHLLINGVFWGCNPLTNHLLTSWDIQVPRL